MQLPQSSAHYTVRTRYGIYAARRLKRAGLESLARDVRSCTLEVRAAGRACEDADDAIQDALADRDAADDGLDLNAQSARNTLAGRGPKAVQEEPYTLIFEQGIGYYTAAPLGEEEARYGEFIKRLEESLPKSDAVRTASVKAIVGGLKDFKTAEKALDEANTASSLLTTKLSRAIHKWDRQLEKTYGLLVAEFGKAGAERFFPKGRSARSSAPAEPPASRSNGNGSSQPSA